MSDLWGYGQAGTVRGGEPSAEPATGGDRVETLAEADGGLIIRPEGALDAVRFRKLLVRTVRKVRPPRLTVDLGGIRTLDAINVGTLAALCDLADDHQITVFLADPAGEVRSALVAAGVPAERIRYTRETVNTETPEVASMS